MSKYIYVFVCCCVAIVSLNARSVQDSIVVVHDIQILGNKITKEYVILREMSIHPGDTLTQAAIDLDRNNIYNLGLFNKVDIEYTVRQNSVTLFVIVSERWYFIPYPLVGMKYRDISKLYYGFGIMDQNFRGRNEKVYTSIGFGYDRWIMLNYQNPKITADDDIFLNGMIAVQKIHNLSSTLGEYENSTTSVSATVGKRFGMYDVFSGSVGYQIWQVNDVQLNRTISPTGRDAFPVISIQYRHDTRDNREYTTNGSFISTSLGKSGFEKAGIDLTSFSYDCRQFFGIHEGSAFGIRTEGSFTWGGNIPPYKHIFFGYDERIRGYFNKEMEAENRISVNAELRLPILLPRYFDFNFFHRPEFRKLRYGLYFAVFIDSGTLWSRHQIFSQQPWYSGVGFGFHFLLPYGFTIRTEIAGNNNSTGEGFIDFDASF